MRSFGLTVWVPLSRGQGLGAEVMQERASYPWAAADRRLGVPEATSFASLSLTTARPSACTSERGWSGNGRLCRSVDETKMGVEHGANPRVGP